MKAYGVPRISDLEHPDVGDIQYFGLASHVGQIAKLSGDFRGYNRPQAKAHARRYFKRKQRMSAKEEIRKELEDLHED